MTLTVLNVLTDDKDKHQINLLHWLRLKLKNRQSQLKMWNCCH